LLLIHQRHLVHRSVADITSHTLGDMNAVIEIHEIWKLVHARPLQRFPGTVARANRLKQLRIGPDLRVTVDARLGRRNSGETRGFNGGMAIATVDAEPRDVMLMAERNRLRLPHSGIGYVGRSLN